MSKFIFIQKKIVKLFFILHWNKILRWNRKERKWMSFCEIIQNERLNGLKCDVDVDDDDIRFFFWKSQIDYCRNGIVNWKKKIGGVEIVDFFFCFFIHFYIDFFSDKQFVYSVCMVEIEIFIDTLFHHCRSISSEDKCVCMQMIEYWLIDWLIKVMELERARGKQSCSVDIQEKFTKFIILFQKSIYNWLHLHHHHLFWWLISSVSSRNKNQYH